jgi:hypothetical protein
MSEPKDHHYLPVFYLNQWCGTLGKVVRYYRPHKKVLASPIAPRNTGYEPQLYSLDGFPNAQKQWIEKYFMTPVVDDPASRAFNRLVNGKELPSNMKPDWVRFLMSLNLRDPATVTEISDAMRRELTNQLCGWYEANKTATDPPTFAEWAKNNAPLNIFENSGKLYLPNFIENSGIGTDLIRMHWFTWDLQSSGITLLTGDRPLIQTHGLKDQRSVVILPISPRFAFVATRAREIADSLHQVKPKRLVKYINEMIVAQAVKHVYGSSDRHLRFVENRWQSRTTIWPRYPRF